MFSVIHPTISNQYVNPIPTLPSTPQSPVAQMNNIPILQTTSSTAATGPSLASEAVFAQSSATYGGSDPHLNVVPFISEQTTVLSECEFKICSPNPCLLLNFFVIH